MTTSIDNGVRSQYASQTTAARSRTKVEEASGSLHSAASGDVVELSDEAKMLNQGSQAAGGKEIVMLSDLMKYTAFGNGTDNFNLMSQNMSRKSIGTRIDAALRAAGIKLGKGEKLSITANAKNEITVSGIKDKDKLAAIEKALNYDPKLGRELRKHAASNRIADYGRRQEAYEQAMQAMGMGGALEGDQPAAAEANPAIQSLIIDEYLQENAGIGLADLSLQTGADGAATLAGANDELRALLDNDEQLGNIINSILERGDPPAEFSATFEYANGVISDNANVDAAKDKVNGIKNKLLNGDPRDLGVLDEFRMKMQSAGVELDPAMETALAQGFKVEVSESGEITIAGLEGLSDRQRATLTDLVKQALDKWAAGKPKDGETREENGRDATMADVAQALIMEHQFEHGDTEEHKHSITIDFSSTANTTQVISPEADKALDETNQALAEELGGKLKGVFEENGVNPAGLELEMDEHGKITVLGNPDDANVQLAQEVVDRWVKEAKDQGAAENRSKHDPAEEAATSEGRKPDGHVPEGFAEQNVVASSGDEAYKQMQYGKWRDEQYENVKQYLPDGEDAGLSTENNMVAFAKYLGWQRSLLDNGGSGAAPGDAEPTSGAQTPRYANSYDDEAMSDSPTGLYLRMLDNLGGYHEGRRPSTFRFKVA